MNERESCSLCYYHDSAEKTCHRYPPQERRSVWPPVQDDHWCGEFIATAVMEARNVVSDVFPDEATPDVAATEPAKPPAPKRKRGRPRKNTTS